MGEVVYRFYGDDSFFRSVYVSGVDVEIDEIEVEELRKHVENLEGDVGSCGSDDFEHKWLRALLTFGRE
ncbi:hypothetical protein A2U01_0017155, partial [Trifolium medium]|nr:hypothetical protein [Trifolium medium]